MTRKKSALAAAIEKTEQAVPVEPVKTPVSPAKAGQGAKAPASTTPKARQGRKARTFFLPPAYWDTLAQMSLQSRLEGEKRTQESLVAEALNDFFARHNLPTIRED